MLFSETPLNDIEDTFKKFVNRDDIDIILINQIVSLVTCAIDEGQGSQ